MIGLLQRDAFGQTDWDDYSVFVVVVVVINVWLRNSTRLIQSLRTKLMVFEKQLA